MLCAIQMQKSEIFFGVNDKANAIVRAGIHMQAYTNTHPC